jgi:hypothetical protein
MIYDGDTMGIFGIPLMECDHPYFFLGAFFIPELIINQLLMCSFDKYPISWHKNAASVSGQAWYPLVI